MPSGKIVLLTPDHCNGFICVDGTDEVVSFQRFALADLAPFELALGRTLEFELKVDPRNKSRHYAVDVRRVADEAKNQRSSVKQA